MKEKIVSAETHVKRAMTHTHRHTDDHQRPQARLVNLQILVQGGGQQQKACERKSGARC